MRAGVNIARQWICLMAAALGWMPLAYASEPIAWRSGVVRLPVQSQQEAVDALTRVVDAHQPRHLLVQFANPIGRNQRKEFERAGISLLTYVGSNAFFASVDPEALDAGTAARSSALIQVRNIERAWKLHSAYLNGRVPDWSILETEAGDPTVIVYALFHRDVSLVPDAALVAQMHGAVVRSTLNAVNGFVLELPLSSVSKLADEDSVQWIEPPLPPLEEINAVTRQVTEAEVVQAPPYDLDGSGVTVLVYDAGDASDVHPDFGGRLVPRDGASISGHATHVACTVGGDGSDSDGEQRGMAPNVAIESYGTACCPPGFLYTDPLDIEQDYTEAINVYGADLANNSIGTNVCNNGLDCEWTGDYGVTSQLIDTIVYGGLGSPFRIVWANGNERSCSRCRNEGVHTPEGYHSTAPPACAKNHITVGALTDTDGVTTFTSWGPTDDGRLKPDISAPGFGVTSCAVGGGYISLSGTSMAAPAVTGILSLLLQDYRAQFPLLDDPRNSTLKILLAHTAVDLGNAGPDYQTGYGSVRIQQAIDFMRSDDGLNFFEATVGNNGVHAVAVRVNPGDGELRITLAWDDFPGTPNVSPALVNDLDLRVFDPDGGQHFPWTLNPNIPSAAAVRTSVDRLNNIEQVYVDAPIPGLWLVDVVGFNVPEGPQWFSLAASPHLVFDCNGNDIPDDEEIQANPSLDCSGNGVLDECEPDCDGDGTVDSCEIFFGNTTDCDANGVPDDCQPFFDCNENGVFDPCDIANGPALDCNGNWVPDECLAVESDCNGNTIPDDCDIAEGTSADCDHDEVPDDCEMVDCNTNDILDACDVMQGTSLDCNENLIPDECEPEGIIHVDDNGPFDPLRGDPSISDPDEDGSSSHPFDAIQEGIDAAACGDTVLVHSGVYTGIGNKDLDTLGKVIRVIGENGPGNSIIDCQGDGRGFHIHSGEDATTVLQGLTIQNASANDGSGIFCDGSSPTISDFVIRDGVAVQGGAGIRCLSSSPLISGCVIAGNTAGSGSGLHCFNQSNPIVENCIFVDNAGAGTVIANGGSTPHLVNCQFVGNLSLGSGNVSYTGNVRPTLTNCLFSGNTAISWGGAIFATLGASPTITNCTFSGNSADRGGAVFCISGCNATIYNSIFWGNTAADGAEITSVMTGSLVTIKRSVVQGGEAGVLTEDGGALSWADGNLDLDPQFVDPNGPDGTVGTLDDNLRLGFDSPGINAGNNLFIPEGIVTDLDGNPRIVEDIVDIGAYERGDFCGDGDCDPLEDLCSCPGDCGGLPSENTGWVCNDGIDNDCNGVADCDDPDCVSGPACTCLVADIPVFDGLGAKNRFVGFEYLNDTWLTAIRVTLTSLPPPNDVANGTVMWLGPPRVICENSGQSKVPPEGCGPAPGLTSRTTTIASLQCEPYFDDWSQFGPVYVAHDLILPNSTVEFQAIGKACDVQLEAVYSGALVVSTSQWGDVVSDCSTNPCGPPNGTIDIVSDVVAILRKFSNAFGAPIKARVDLTPAQLDFKIDISDVLETLGAFQGNTFPYAPPPTSNPCAALRPQ